MRGNKIGENAKTRKMSIALFSIEYGRQLVGRVWMARDAFAQSGPLIACEPSRARGEESASPCQSNSCAAG
jgi:hypothetical protein